MSEPESGPVSDLGPDPTSARPRTPVDVRRRNRRLFVSLSLIVVVGFGAIVMLRVRYHPMAMMTRSMSPTYPAGTTLLNDRAAYRNSTPERFDVVVFQPPHDPTLRWCFRVVGLPGERITFTSVGLCIDGEPIELPQELAGIEYVPDWGGGSLPETATYPYLVGHDRYFLLGDNPERARDSRSWGDLPFGRIEGKVVADW